MIIQGVCDDDNDDDDEDLCHALTKIIFRLVLPRIVVPFPNASHSFLFLEKDSSLSNFYQN